MVNRSKDRPPFVYPEYIHQMLRHLMECSLSDKYPLLYDKADLISVLYNQFNDYPITDQVYNLVWMWANKMVDAGCLNWVKDYWSQANQYFLFKLEYTTAIDRRQSFLEFHVMLGTMLTYNRQFELLRYITQFTNSLPAKYPLIPSSFSRIFSVYEELSKKNERMYLLKYRMLGLNTGAGNEYKIEGHLLDYLALLLIRLNSVNDYDITFSNPFELPSAGGTIEENERKKQVITILEKKVNKWAENEENLKSCGIPISGCKKAIELLDSYCDACGAKQQETLANPKLSESKRKEIRQEMIFTVNSLHYELPFKKSIGECAQTFLSTQEIILDKELILEGYDRRSSNLGEALVQAIYIQLRNFYCYQFLLHSPIKSYTIPYRNMGEAMERLSINNNFSILALGVSPHFFDETLGFVSMDDFSIKYKDIEVLNIPSNYNCILIMKKDDVPYVVARQMSQHELSENLGMSEIEDKKHLYSNIDNLTCDNLNLKVCTAFDVTVPTDMKYVKIRIAYHLAPDEMILRSVESISNFIV